jgi:hypothetical protein
MGVLGSIFGFGNTMKKRLRDAVSNPLDYAEMSADQNQNEWEKNPEERAMGFFNPIPLGSVNNFHLQKKLAEAATSLSRREFLKRSAGIAGGTAAASVPGAKLLQKFAPEERALAKEANAAKQAAVEAAPKYKYNSLKEYLDDVQMWAKEDFKEGMSKAGIGGNFRGREDYLKQRLLQDEDLYKQAKEIQGEYHSRPGYYERDHGWSPATKEDVIARRSTLDSFSPQAKKEMKNWKELIRRHEASRMVDATPEGKAFWKTIGDDPGYGDNVFPKGYDEYSRLHDVTNKMLEETYQTVNWADNAMNYLPR